MTNKLFSTVQNRRNTASIKWDKYDNQDVIPMWVADMDFAIAESIQSALRERLSHPVLGYTRAPDGLADTIINSLQQRYNWQVQADWLVWLPGVVPGLTAACGMLGQQGDQVLVPSPVYHPLLQIPPKLKRNRIDSPLKRIDGRWSFDFDLLGQQAASGKVSSLLLCSPHNPVGTVFSIEELQQLVSICAKHGITVVSDEIHCDLVLSQVRQHVPTALAAESISDQIITLMSPSKTFNLAGANASFAIIPDPGLRERFREACHFSVPIVPTLSYVAARAAYSSGWDWQAQLIDYLRTNLAIVREHIDDIPGLWMDDIEATYLGWINTSALPVADACEFFQHNGVGLSPGAQFGDGNYQRLNFACPQETLLEALAKIREAVITLNSA